MAAVTNSNPLTSKISEFLESETLFLESAKLEQLKKTSSKIHNFLFENRDYLISVCQPNAPKVDAREMEPVLTLAIDEIELRRKTCFKKEIVQLSSSSDERKLKGSAYSPVETLLKKEMAVDYLKFKQETAHFPMEEIRAEAFHILSSIGDDYLQMHEDYYSSSNPIEQMLEVAKEWQKSLQQKALERSYCVIL